MSDWNFIFNERGLLLAIPLHGASEMTARFTPTAAATGMLTLGQS